MGRYIYEAVVSILYIHYCMSIGPEHMREFGDSKVVKDLFMKVATDSSSIPSMLYAVATKTNFGFGLF